MDIPSLNKSPAALLPLLLMGCPRSTPVDTAAERAPDGSLITLSGTIVSAQADRFRLDYGPGTMIVEMDDWDDTGEAIGLLEDDQVVVYGFVDDDFYERRTIEASTVYVQNLGTYFYASGVDEEDVPPMLLLDIEPRVSVRGTVQSVQGRELVLGTGPEAIEVDTVSMPYNPLDDEGYQRIEVGDRIYVSGVLDDDLFDSLEVAADRIAKLDD